ncbi:MAG: DUF4852 domain-containing protein [Micavibrio aeruginosavorus]|uniref:DUF4852 domain-containing protein n=1 Tax=Micavibrio aeruginosavorus TaxID=349221 RepID=A0A7T5UFQ1_9BACT|nr:MAG: DUF4852 domain-containing protein [Micavibrio aeruginosavorus]
MAAHQGGFSFERYVDPTVYNLAHLYWTLGMLDLNNNDHIDNFLLVTECNMFQTYVTNDLEWAEIRENTRNFLRENYRYFPTYFKISIPLYLRNYDTKLERFDVDQAKSAVDNARRIDTIYNTALTVCGKSGEIEGYPKNLILLLNRPFNLPYVPVEMELARLFLDERNSQQIRHSLTTATTKEAHERLAVLELMIRVHTYRETMTTVSGLLKAAVFAQIDYIRVFADIGKEKLLYEQDMFENQNRSVKRKSGPVVIDGKNMPQGPLFGTIVEDEEE